MDTNMKVLLVLAAVAVLIIGAFVATGMPGSEEGGGDGNVVTYYGNGGSLDGDTKTTSPLTTAVDYIFENGSKTCVGWNTKSNGSGTWYYKGSAVSPGTVLYAIWADYSVTWGQSSSTGVHVSVPITVDGKSISGGACGYNAPNASNKVFLNVFDSSFTNVSFVNYNHSGTTDTIVLSANKNTNYDVKVVQLTLEFVHSGYSGPLFKEGSNKVENGVFSMEIIGSCNSTVNTTMVTSNPL